MTTRERKGYLDRMRKNQQASLCPECGRKTRHFTVPSKETEGAVDIQCEYCEKTVQTGVVGVPAYIPVRLYANGGIG